MPQDSLRYSGQRSKMKWIAWGLASLLFFFTVENIWVDPWLRSKHHRMPSLVPEALSGTWFLAFAVGGIALILLFLTEILLIRDRAGSLWTKTGTGLAAIVVLLLSAQWVLITNGKPGVFSLRVSSKKHSATLTWNASTSHVAGYNVYRRTLPALGSVKLNSTPVPGVTFPDNSVENGAVYDYVVRAVDAAGNESAPSNDVFVPIPAQ